MSGREPTVDEYKTYVKDLKMKIKRLQDKNRELVTQVVNYKATAENRYGKADCNAAVAVSKKVTKLQSCWRGILARRKFKQVLRNAAADRPRDKAMTNQLVMNKAKDAAEKLHLSLEMVYRASDKRMTGAVLLDEFKLFLQQLRFPLSAAQTAR